MFKRHKHNWVMEDKTIIPAAINNPLSNIKGDAYIFSMLLEAMTEHVVYAYKCECGAIKVIKE